MSSDGGTNLVYWVCKEDLAGGKSNTCLCSSDDDNPGNLPVLPTTWLVEYKIPLLHNWVQEGMFGIGDIVFLILLLRSLCCMIVNSFSIAVMLLLPSFVCLNKICNGSRLLCAALPQLDPIFFVQQLFPDDYNICKKRNRSIIFPPNPNSNSVYIAFYTNPTKTLSTN